MRPSSDGVCCCCASGRFTFLARASAGRTTIVVRIAAAMATKHRVVILPRPILFRLPLHGRRSPRARNPIGIFLRLCEVDHTREVTSLVTDKEQGCSITGKVTMQRQAL